MNEEQEELEMFKKIKELREKGYTIAQISKEIGKSITYVYHRLNENYYPKKIKELIKK